MTLQFTGTLRLSATDLSNHLGCLHLTALNLASATGRIRRPQWKDPGLDVLYERGLEHERAYVSHLRDQGLRVIELPDEGVTERAVGQTLSAMREGADVVVQATLISGRWNGRADVLRRTETPSDLGAWSYEVIDTKLARETRGGTILQLCLYSDIVREVQGLLPEKMYVVTPGTDFLPEQYRVRDYLAFYARARTRLETSVVDVGADLQTYPEPCPHCDICQWRVVCDRQRRNDDHLCLVAGISKMQTRELQERDVSTLKALGELASPLPFRPTRGSVESYGRIREQARIQLEGRNKQEPAYELLPVEEGQGLARLPAPSPGDVFFDFEGDPFVEPHGREYLFGYVTIEGGEESYRSLWAMTAQEERAAFQAFIGAMMERWRCDPGFHIYHYAPYEPAAIKRLMGRYATCEEEVDRLLRAERFMDLHAVVKRALRASVEKYSIKDLEPFYGFARAVDLRDANLQRFALEHTLELRNETAITAEMRNTVEGYNRDDCLSTRFLRDWLEGLRARQIAEGESIPRPDLKGEPTEQLSQEQQRVRDLMDRLTHEVPIVLGDRTKEQQARWLLAQMLEWHRREDKVVWWEYYRLRDLTEEEMLDERNALAGLALLDRVGTVKRSVVDRYVFPAQETTIQKGDVVKASLIETGRYAEVVATGSPTRTIDLKKGPKTADIHARTVFVHDAVPAGVLKESMFRLAQWVQENGIDSEGPWRAARDLLLRHTPRLRTRKQGALQESSESTLEAARRLVLDLNGGILPIQGPPGCGKTYTGARMICDLVSAGQSVGVTAVSHKVIRNLLDKTVEAAGEEGVTLRAVQKVGQVADDDHPIITQVDKNEAVSAALRSGAAQVAAGTAWLWARQDMAQAVDVLFVDEAGQMSLANVLAVSAGARNIVLLGDPQQLEQPQHGSHPEGTDVSALEHILTGQLTMPKEQGLFLGETWRLPPPICRYTSELFYENRLRSREGLEGQRLLGEGVFTGAGLWFVPVHHDGNTHSSSEEVACVADLVRTLTSGRYSWKNTEGDQSPLGLSDILVVAPYNAHVAALSEQMPGARVGTVDKFQGQEAPVVIYSMATSSPDEAPRGMEFLYSLNRLNVATSRAKCACILVSSPRLLEAECHTPRRIRLANAFCRYVEMAVKAD